MRKNVFKNIDFVILSVLIGAGLNSNIALARDNFDGSNNGGQVNITGGEYGYVWGIQGSNNNVATNDNNYANGAKVIVNGNVIVSELYGGNAQLSALCNEKDQVNETKNNSVFIGNGAIIETVVFGGYAVSGLQGSGTYNIQTTSEGNTVIFDNATIKYNAAGNLYGNVAQHWGANGEVVASGIKGQVTIDIKNKSQIETIVVGNYAASVFGGKSYVIAKDGYITVTDSNVSGYIAGGMVDRFASEGNTLVSNNVIEINQGSYVKDIYAGRIDCMSGREKGEKEISDNTVIINGGTIDGNIYASYFYNENDVENISKNNNIILNGNSNVRNANLYGANIMGENTTDNSLIIDNWKGQQVNSLNNFNNIKFQNIDWENEGIVVEVLNNNATTSLENTMIDLRNSTTLSGGVSLKENDYMYFIKSANGSIGTNENNILVNQDGESDNIFTAGVALEGTGKVEVEADGSVKYTITDVNNTEQIDIVPVNSSLAAAFVINGNDLVVDGLNAMEQDQLFGVKTFAIVEGHDSSYDVADDLKVNGWNGLYGVGNIKEYKDGNLSYAAFFENGTANYRTFNSFMDEVIRGDGSIVYNGGGIAGRYKKNDGFYTEASLRAGLLKNELKNMFKDGNGSIYGYKTESPYYAFHLGIGKVIDIEEDRNIDLYARYYHTYNDGDNFTVAGDRFEVDSITSDKVRIGTRYNINNDKDISTYYGLAWEYEFNGDADVSVNGQKLPGETLQGSSGFAEIGFVQRNSSPWSFEGRVHGYVGEREGVSGLLRATYSF